MNNIVGLSFEEKFVELDNLCVPQTMHGTHYIRCKCIETDNPNGG